MVYEQEKIKPYKQDGKKGEQVEQMFDHIAHSYDQLNHRLSWNIDKMWRNAAIKKLAEKQPQTILDVATGTGDFAIKAAEALKPAKVLGIDISEKMMEIGQQKVAARGLQDIISFKKEDCTALTLPSNSFDAVMAAFGIRNFADLDKGLAEMCRVLKSADLRNASISLRERDAFRSASWTLIHISRSSSGRDELDEARGLVGPSSQDAVGE